MADYPPQREDARVRLRIFVSLVLVAIGLLSYRLADLQLFGSEAYIDEAQGNAIRPIRVRPARGYIFDRSGELIVDNRPTISLRISTRYFDPQNLQLLAQLLGRPDSVVVNRWNDLRGFSTFQTQTMFGDIPFEAYARLKENEYLLPGIEFEEGQIRRYHGQARLAHALGYVNEISSGQLEMLREQGEYRQGDYVGITGIESEYENILRGQPGRHLMLVNSRGMTVGRFQEGTQDRDPRSGYELHLTIDARTQALAESLFVNKRGGLVALDTETGGIIAMVSGPDYDPGGFAGRMSQDFADYVWNNPERPLYNRATMMAQPPGSTWKSFMSVAALQEGIITETSRINCPGGMNVGGRFFRCLGVHGSIDVRTAIQRSCNTFFYALMMRMDLNRWARYARAFGYGTLAPIDFPEQASGLIPDSSYFNRVFPRGWAAGTTVNLGIGQGNILTTPLQMARFTMAVANGGLLHAPHMILRQVDPIAGESYVPARPRTRQLPINRDYLDIVKDGMRLAVEAGTGARTRHPVFSQGGKTGTVQNPQGDNHSMYIGFGPVENSRIAVAVMVENAGFGSTVAAPIASLVMEQFLTGEIIRPEMVTAIRAQRSQRVGVR
ncbi:penicillin-binding protein 2 [soil metagenome]